MKKILSMTLVLIIAFSAIACNSTADSKADPSISGSLEEIMKSIYAGVDAEFSVLGNTVVTKENVAYYLGTEEIKFTEALASEPMMSSVAHSVVLVRVEAGTDIEAAKQMIKDKVDGRKWICVGVEDANILVENVGDLIVLVMDNEQSQALADSFKALAK